MKCEQIMEKKIPQESYEFDANCVRIMRNQAKTTQRRRTVANGSSRFHREGCQTRRDVGGRELLRIALGFLVFYALSMSAQSADSTTPYVNSHAPQSLLLSRIDDSDEILIDGKLDEEAWSRATKITDFRVNNGDPENLGEASEFTEAYVFYSDRGLYVAAEMPQISYPFVERISEQDASNLDRDFFTVMLDPSGEGTYGFFFTIFLGGNHLDGTLLPERNFDHTWDGVWYSGVRNTSDSWSVEFHIPWSIVNMPRVKDERTIGILLERHVATIAEKSSWPVLHSSAPRFLSDFSALRVSEIKPPQQLDFFPYASTTKDLLNDRSSHRYGTDVFWRPSTNFQLTATLNPDFGTVEADAVILNFSAYETFFPEKRLFFQEGMEVFSFVGNSFNPLNTRRIGATPIVHDLPLDAQFDYEQFSKPSELTFAAKTTGQLGPMRFGVLGASEDDTVVFGRRDDASVRAILDGRDFAATRLLYENRKRGYRSFGILSTVVDHPSVLAQTNNLDVRHQSTSGNFSFHGTVHSSYVTNQPDGYGASLSSQFRPNSKDSHQLSVGWMDDDLDLNHMGFQSRNDITLIGYGFDRTRYFDSGRLRETQVQIGAFGSWNSAGERLSAEVSIYNFLEFPNLNAFWWNFIHRLPSVDDRNAFGDGSFHQNSSRYLSLDFRSNTTKKFNYRLWTGAVEETNMGIATWRGGAFNWRIHEKLNFSISTYYDHSDSWLLYQGNRRFSTFGSESLSLIAGISYFVNAKQHIRFDLDWSSVTATERERYRFAATGSKLVRTEESNFGNSNDFAFSQVSFQIRYRWEIAPISDLYVVYTQGSSLPDAMGKNFRTMFRETFDYPNSKFLVAKIRYRFGRKKASFALRTRLFLDKSLTTSYSRMGKPHTTIGAETFHF